MSDQRLAADRDIRCHCGHLVARWVRQGLEIKCKRCRRLIQVPFTAIGGSPPASLKRPPR